MIKKEIASVDQYIQARPQDVQPKLRKLRNTIRKAAPGAVEVISYRVPTLKLNGQNLVHFAAFKNHISLFPTSSAIRAFKRELVAFKTAKGTVQFPLDRAIPYDLVERIVAFRVAELSRTAG